MSDDLFLNERYDCNNKIYRKKINCEYWSVDTETCTTNCSLKNISPREVNCYVCKERKKVQEVVPQQITIEKTRQYVKAEASQFFSGKVSQEVFEKRKELCMSCDKRKNISPEAESIGWCTACGCGWKTRAALSQKLYIPTISCPLNKFGPEKGSGFSVKAAAESISGVASSIKETITKDDK